MPESDPFLRSLADLEVVLDENVERARQMKRRIAKIRREREQGRAYAEIVSDESPPLIVQLLSQSSRALDEYGARARRTEALVLHEEGLTMDRIAELFGVTRQRVSGLLRDARETGG